MSDILTIDKGIPMPCSGSGTKYPFADMEIGDSFFIDAAERARVSSAADFHRKKYGRQFAVRKFGDGIRVWRIA